MFVPFILSLEFAVFMCVITEEVLTKQCPTSQRFMIRTTLNFGVDESSLAVNVWCHLTSVERTVLFFFALKAQ